MRAALPLIALCLALAQGCASAPADEGPAGRDGPLAGFYSAPKKADGVVLCLFRRTVGSFDLAADPGLRAAVLGGLAVSRERASPGDRVAVLLISSAEEARVYIARAGDVDAFLRKDLDLRSFFDRVTVRDAPADVR